MEIDNYLHVLYSTINCVFFKKKILFYMKRKSNKVNRFWMDYRQAVIASDVPESIAKWYVKWAIDFDAFLKGKPLRERTAADIRSFLEKLCENPKIEPWQVQQAQDALAILYRDFLEIDMGSIELGPLLVRHPENEWDQTRNKRFRDQVKSEQAFTGRHAALFERLTSELRLRHYSIRTEQAYVHWIRRFFTFHNQAPVAEIGPEGIRAFLKYLAEVRKVSASTQNQALNAVVFFYGQVLKADSGQFSNFTRAKRTRRLPEVLTKTEVQKLLACLKGKSHLMAGLLYGGGLRLTECVRLRVKDINFEQRQILVRDGKGQKDRITVLPEKFIPLLKKQIAHVKRGLKEDLAAGSEGADIWPALKKNIPTQVGTLAGSMCFRHPGCPLILGPESPGGTISMPVLFKRR